MLFPNSSTGLVEGVYQGNPVADFFNDRMADVVEACARARAAASSEPRLRILEVQPESRRPMSAYDWAMGARLGPGARLG